MVSKKTRIEHRARMSKGRPPAVVRKIIYGDTAFHYDCVLEQGGLELSVSRETSPTENPREYWGNFASKSVSIVPESEFAFSSVRVPSLTLNSGVARMRWGCRYARPTIWRPPRPLAQHQSI